jgi:DNA-binding response OmpR family regulator
VALAHELDFDCVVAGTAKKRCLASELRPNGILLDIGLPDVSGLSVLERLKRNPIPATSRCTWSRRWTAARWRASWVRLVSRSS